MTPTREELEAGAARIPCPRCPAVTGEPCETPRGVELERPHADRIKAYRAELETARRRAEGDATHRIDHARWRRVYVACRMELEQRAAWTLLAAEQLESMVLNMAQAEVARTKAKASPTVEGSMGQAVANPAVAIALRYDAQALQTAIQLKLTPATRGTSVEVPAGDDVPQDAPEEERDELAAIDELARRRKARPAGGKAKRKASAK
jgi:hypothetical protein